MDCGSKPVLEVCTQLPLPFMGNEHAALELPQLTEWTSLELFTLVNVRMGVTVKLEEKVPPSLVVMLKFMVPVSLWVARVAVTWKVRPSCVCRSGLEARFSPLMESGAENELLMVVLPRETSVSAWPRDEFKGTPVNETTELTGCEPNN